MNEVLSIAVSAEQQSLRPYYTARKRWQKIAEAVDIAFQPIVDIHTGRLFGVEALIRNFEACGFTSPLDLLDSCHAEGELAETEARLLAKAFDKFIAVPGHKGLKLFVNLDGRTVVASDGVRTQLEAMRQSYGLTNAHLALEVSERFDFSETQEGLDQLLKLRHTFGNLTLDDFGAGHANLQMFYHVEPNIVKLDRFLISSIGTDPKKTVFLQHIVMMAHLLGSLVVAEGVETPQEYYVCRDLGCDLVQGYAVARPTTKLEDLQSTYFYVSNLHINDRRKKDNSDLQLIMAQLDTVEPIRIDAGMRVVFDRFAQDRDRTFFPVVDEVGSPMGLIHERDLKSFFYSMYGRELIRNPRRTIALTSFIRHCSVANINTSPEKILEVFSTRPNSEGVMMVKESRYGGFLHASALLTVINEKNLSLARDQNPLTKLPGNILIQDYLANATTEADAVCHFAYLDFDNFKPFNDRYGFRTGDRAILMCADILRAEFGRADRFIGHVGGDDFFVGFRNVDGDQAAAEIAQVLAKFKTDVESLYPPKDRNNGYMVSYSRKGKLQKFPLLSISGVVLHKPQGTALQSVDYVSGLIAEAKKEAKATPGNIVRLIA